MNPRIPTGVRRLLERLALIGAVPGDPDEVRVQKVTLTLAAVTVTVLSVVWVGTYFVLGLPLSAAIPFAYQVFSVASLVAFARTKDYRLFRFSQIVLMLLLPFLLQWSLGGYVASSAVSLWALIGVFGALFFYSARQAVPWFAGFVALTVVSGLADPLISQTPAAIPATLVEAFFVLNIVGVSLTAYLHAPIRRQGARRGTRPVGGSAAQRPATLDRGAAEAPAGRHRRAVRGRDRPVRRRRRLHAVRRADQPRTRRRRPRRDLQRLR